MSVANQFMNSPKIFHWDVIMHILRYLKKAPRCGILYKNHDHYRIEGFSNTTSVGCHMDRRFTSKYYMFVSGLEK